MTAVRRLVLVTVLLLTSFTPLSAQDTVLRLGTSIDGNLPTGDTHRYSFTALEWTLISLRVEALEATLDPRLEIFDSSGELLIANDDYDYPNSRDAALQAFLIPRTATYTITISGVGASGGAYRLHFLPGYDVLTLHDTEMRNSNWEVVYSDGVVQLSDSSLFAVELKDAGRSAVILGLHLPLELDLYFEAAFESVSARSSWQVGLVFRYLAPDRYHRLLLSNQGYWLVERVNGDIVTPVKGWLTHPAIVPAEPDFRLGVLVSGSHFDIVYNGQVVGSAKDDSPPERGGVGLAMRTDDASGGNLSFAVREIILTTPTRLGDALLFPEQLLVRRYFLMADELTRQQLVPAYSEFKLTVAESSVRASQPGVTDVSLAPERSFQHFAYGAAITIDVPGGGNGGCGLTFHGKGDEDYTLAYFTRDGDSGLSRRSVAGFDQGIYRSFPAFPESTNYLLVVAARDRIHLYVDEHYAGSMEYEAEFGGLGIAVVNYDAVFTSCLFSDLWILGFDS